MTETWLLDASVVLAYLQEEPGWERMEPILASGNAAISAVNLAEVASKLANGGMPREDIAAVLADLELATVPFDDAQVVETAMLRPLTRTQRLSLGDRACLATARVMKRRVMTADRAWLELALGIEIEPLR